jgi:hypothetical protein
MVVTIRAVEDLRNPVNRCRAAVNKSDSNGLHGCLLFEAVEDDLTGRLSITAVDSRSHQLTLSLSNGLVDIHEPGSVLVPYDYIADLLSRLPGAQALTLEVDAANKMLVKCNPDQFDVYLHQGSVDSFKISVIDENDLPSIICSVPGPELTRLVTDSVGIITDQEDFKLVGTGTTLHAYSHDRGSNIVSHTSLETPDQSCDWAASMSSRLVKLVNKYWMNTVNLHLRETNPAMLAFSSEHDYFVIRQLNTNVDVSMLDDALGIERVGAFVVDGASIRGKARLLDLAKGIISVEVRNNILRFDSSYAARGTNNVKVPILDTDGEQPKSQFSKDLLKRALSAMDVGQLRGEWVPLNEDEQVYFLRFVDEDLPEHRQVIVCPVN